MDKPKNISSLRGSRPPTKQFLLIKNHGVDIATAHGNGDSERAIARRLGTSHTLVNEAVKVMSKFEKEIASGDFDPIERHLFEPIGKDYKLMPFYKKFLAEQAGPKPKRQQVKKGRGVEAINPPVSVTPTSDPTPVSPKPAVGLIQPNAPKPVAAQTQPDPFFDSANAASALLTQVNKAAVKPKPSASTP